MRPFSALVSVGGFGVAVALMSVGTAAALVLLVPAPPPARKPPLTAMTALCCGGPGFIRAPDLEPRGRRVVWMEQLFAIEMQRESEDVRVVWLDPPDPTAIRGFAPARLAALDWRERRSLLRQEQPAILAAVRANGNAWISVRPDPPWLNGWRLKVLVALGASLACLTALALLLARHLTRPFRRLTDALEGGSDMLLAGGPRELRDAVAVLVDTRLRLEREVAERQRILAAVAHDLRTPLTALRLRAEGVDGARRGRMIGDIERMGRMVDEVLAFTHAAAMPRERLAVRDTLREAVAGMPGGDGRLRLLPGVDAWVDVPPLGLRRAVDNLLHNALDYAGHGEVELTVKDGMVTIYVRDRGPGMDPADAERMLRPFERGDASRNPRTGGVGLGLSIVQNFAVQEGGAFMVSSNPCGGTLATLELPTARPAVPGSGRNRCLVRQN